MSSASTMPIATSNWRDDGGCRSSRPISVLCLISGLEYGGAEMMLYKLLSRMDRRRFSFHVISMIEPGPMSGRIRDLGIPLQSLGMRRRIPNPMGILRLINWLRHTRPDVIQTWMYHADLVGGLAAKVVGNIPVAWNIRFSNFSANDSPQLSIYTMKMCAKLSKWLPARVVCCSESSRQVHIKLGYVADKMIVIPNGFNLGAFTPNPEARASVRKELKIPDDAVLIGNVGRFDPQKDHRNFIKAAGLLIRSGVDAHFVLCGDDMTWDNTQLASWFQEVDIRERFHLLGHRDDMPRITAALDISCISSSFGEGFPNVVAEAMAAGVPCVVTNVGDSALIVGQTGVLVPPGNSHALSSGLRKLVELGREGRMQLGTAARQRIKENFDLPDIVTRYQNLYQEIASGSQGQ